MAAPVAKFLDDEKPPILEYMPDSKPAAVCRMCLMEAIAPIDKPIEGHPDAGWWHRMWLKGDFEPRGVA